VRRTQETTFPIRVPPTSDGANRARTQRGRTLEIRTARCGAVDPLTAARFGIGVAALAFAAVSDVRTRRVRDPLWLVLGTAGLGLLLIELATDGADALVYPFIAGTAILFYGIFFGAPLFDEDGFHPRPARIGVLLSAAALVAGPLAVAGSSRPVTTAIAAIASMPVMVVLYQALYQARLIVGGADAKALIALTLLVPAYPNTAPLLAPNLLVEATMNLVFPFSLVVFVDAAVLLLAVPLALLVYNAARGDLAFPAAFLGYRRRLDELPRHVWIMEQVDAKGEQVLVLFPPRTGDSRADAERLRAAGKTEAWVQPKIPLMVPLSVGFVLAFFVGNLLLAVLPR